MQQEAEPSAEIVDMQGQPIAKDDRVLNILEGKEAPLNETMGFIVNRAQETRDMANQLVSLEAAIRKQIATTCPELWMKWQAVQKKLGELQGILRQYREDVEQLLEKEDNDD